MGRVNWTQIVAFVGIVAVVFVVGVLLLPLVFGWYGGSWAMGPGMMGGQTQGGWCPFCGGTGRYSGGFFGGAFAWVLMVMTFLFPLGLLALLVVGIVWVARAAARSSNETHSSGHTCPKCGKAIEVDWRACPFCREDLERLG
jgi:uncharacterized membrane protein